MSPSAFKPQDIADLSGRVFFITGGTAGLGAGSIGLLAAKNPAHIYFSGRNKTRADALIARIKSQHPNVSLTFIACDLADMSSVRQAAETFLSSSDRLDVLYCNAGIMALPPGLTKDGYELQFGTNHLGHALLIKLLLPVLQRTAAQPNADVRIINMSSVAYTYAPKEGIDFTSLNTDQHSLGSMIPGGKWTRYGQSKLANMLYARELARRYPEIKTVAVHPGYIKTDLFANTSFLTSLPPRMFVPFTDGWTPVAEGPYNQTWAGTTARANLEDGAYYVPIGKKGKLGSDSARDESGKLSAKLWEWTQTELEKF